MKMINNSPTRRQARPVAHSIARLELTRARAYINDLKRWHAGDVGRFNRMVSGRGRQLGDPDTWIKYLRVILSRQDVWQYQSGVCRRMVRDLDRLGYKITRDH